MLYKRRRIVKRVVIIYNVSEFNVDRKHVTPVKVKGRVYKKKFIFHRINGEIFSCVGCILQGNCNGIYTVKFTNSEISKYCRFRSKFYNIGIYYNCYAEETICYYGKEGEI